MNDYVILSIGSCKIYLFLLNTKLICWYKYIAKFIHDFSQNMSFISIDDTCHITKTCWWNKQRYEGRWFSVCLYWLRFIKLINTHDIFSVNDLIYICWPLSFRTKVQCVLNPGKWHRLFKVSWNKYTFYTEYFVFSETCCAFLIPASTIRYQHGKVNRYILSIQMMVYTLIHHVPIMCK
jgi:hypothetical protein